MIQRILAFFLIFAALAGSGTGIVAQADVSITLEFVLGKGQALSSAWSPDGDVIAVGSTRSLWLYTAALEEIGQLAEEPANRLAWSPQGNLLVSENDHGLAVWDVAANVKLAQLDGYSFPVAWSPDGAMLTFVASDNQLVVWDIVEQDEHIVIPVQSPDGVAYIWFLAWDTGRLIGIVGNYDPATRIHHDRFLVWDVQTGEVLSAVDPATDTLDAVAASFAGLIGGLDAISSEIVLADQDRFLRFDVQNEHPLFIADHESDALYDLKVSPDGKRFATIDRSSWQVSLWDTETLTLLAVMRDGAEIADSVSHLAWSPDSQYLLTDAPGMIKIWDATTGQIVRQRADYMAPVNDLAWSPDGEMLAVVGGDDSAAFGDFRLRLWQMQSQHIVSVCEGAFAPILSVDWDPEGTRLVTTAGGFYHQDTKVRIWNADTCMSEGAAEGHSIMITDSAWSPDGHSIAAQVGGGIELWNPDNLSAEPRSLPIGLSENTVWHPDYPWMVVELDGNIELYDMSEARVHVSGEPHSQVEPMLSFPSQLELVRGVAWNSSGTQLAVGGGRFVTDAAEETSNYDIEIWDITTETRVHTLAGHEAPVIALSWDPTGRFLASASADRTVRLWNTATGELLAVLEGHDDLVSAVDWHPDGIHLASGSHDGTVRIWALALD